MYSMKNIYCCRAKQTNKQWLTHKLIKIAPFYFLFLNYGVIPEKKRIGKAHITFTWIHR